MTDTALAALGIFVLLYAVLVGEWVHRAAAAMAAGLLVVLLGFLSPAQALAAEDWNTILLLFGLMLLVSLGEEVGLFSALAAWVRRVAGPTPWGTILGFLIFTAALSSVLPNLSVILIMGPALFSAAENLNLDPVPLLVFAIMASNLGG
jgi:Na+/H+ antiporter NhaD/arsenite permease-like protein